MRQSRMINTDKLAAVTTLAKGAHEADSGAMCAMEAVAYIAGEPWSDAPACASPVVASFMRLWNDALPDADRTRLLLPLVPEIVGTRTTDADDVTRGWMAADWLVRTHAPAWLTLAELPDHAAALASCHPITSDETARQASLMCESAKSAAESAAWDTARSAAGSAVGSAAGYAAWYAARSAVGYAARSAVGSAAWSAAGSAAWYAAWYAAVGASSHEKDLAPTVAMLQASAQDLVRRMCAVGRVPEEDA